MSLLSFIKGLCDIGVAQLRASVDSYAHGKRTRSAQAVIAPHLSVANARLCRALLRGRLCPAPADRNRVHGQSRLERVDHFRAHGRHGTVISAGPAAFS